MLYYLQATRQDKKQNKNKNKKQTHPKIREYDALLF